MDNRHPADDPAKARHEPETRYEDALALADRLGMRLLFAHTTQPSHLTTVLARPAVALAAGPVPAVALLSHGSRVETGV